MSNANLQAIPEMNSWEEVENTISALGKHPQPPKEIYQDKDLRSFLVERVKSNHTFEIQKSNIVSAHTGLFARKDIEEGEEIFRTKPLVACIEPGLIPKFCDYCKSTRNRAYERNWKPVWCEGCGLCAYCSKDCLESAWLEYHKKECQLMQQKPHQKAISRDLVLYRLVAKALVSQDAKQVEMSGNSTVNSSSDQQQALGSSSSQTPHNIKSRKTEYIHPLAYRTIGLLKSHIEQREPYLGEEKPFSKPGEFMLEVFEELSLTLRELEVLYMKVITNSIKMNSPEGGTYSHFGAAFDTTASLINHSCQPNIIVFFEKGYLRVNSLKPIKTGEELLRCYVDVHESTSFRLEHLIWGEAAWETPWVDCNCPRCEGKTPDEDFQRALVNTTIPLEERLDQLVEYQEKIKAAIGLVSTKQQQPGFLRHALRKASDVLFEEDPLLVRDDEFDPSEIKWPSGLYPLPQAKMVMAQSLLSKNPKNVDQLQHFFRAFFELRIREGPEFLRYWWIMLRMIGKHLKSIPRKATLRTTPEDYAALLGPQWDKQDIEKTFTKQFPDRLSAKKRSFLTAEEMAHLYHGFAYELFARVRELYGGDVRFLKMVGAEMMFAYRCITQFGHGKYDSDKFYDVQGKLADFGIHLTTTNMVKLTSRQMGEKR